MINISPILDQPQSIEYNLLPAGPFHRLANHELTCRLDADSNAYELCWPWADEVYARSLRLSIIDWQDGELMPLATRFFAGHQETIAGTEGVIVTKRLALPYKSTDDRALLWLLECQAEGDRLLRLEIDIDWGEELSQRIVDGLLVAQRNPGPARGIYRQSNADSTRIFGNPQGRPVHVDLDDPQHARLTYYVLVNGIVEVPLLLTVSDVGEQVAWSTFVSLRDVEDVFDASTRHWEQRVLSGRVWTPDPALNQAMETARLTAVRHLQRLRTGLAPSDRRTAHVAPLASVWDTLDPTQSRNLLAHLRRVAEASDGRLPALLPALPKSVAADPGPAYLHTNGVYLRALHSHLNHHGPYHPKGNLVEQHLAAVRLCTEALIRLRSTAPHYVAEAHNGRELAAALGHACALANAAGDTVNAARWESEWHYVCEQVGQESSEDRGTNWAEWPMQFGWQPDPDLPWSFTDPWQGMELASAVVWEGIGLRQRDADLLVEPGWDHPWWAVLNLSLTQERQISLLWDGTTLHSTQPVTSSVPVRLRSRIDIRQTDEFGFDPYFELSDDSGDTVGRERFKPGFLLNQP
ncbi:MAG: hypothetical protein H3C34_02790 [Caldilineaceae bacterium]|nr:hypothetical protein [Caldilineaceae bacterium]